MIQKYDFMILNAPGKGFPKQRNALQKNDDVDGYNLKLVELY